MEHNRQTMKKIMLLITFTVGLLVGLQHLDILISIFWTIIGMIQPLLAGICIAYILNVPMRAIENALFVRLPGPKGRDNQIIRMIRRPVSLLLAILVVIGILLIAIFIVGPELGRTLGNLMQSIPVFFQETQKWAEEMLKKYPDIVKQISEIKIDWSALIQQGVEFVKNGAGGVVNSTIGFAGSVANGMMNTVFSFIFAMYMLLQKEKLCGQGRRVFYAWLPEKAADTIMSVLTLSNRVFSRFISGQCLEAFILGSMFFVTLSIFQFPYALMISVMVMCLALMPRVGACSAGVLGALQTLPVNPMQAVIFVILFQVLQQIEGNFIYPHVMGTSIGLPPLWVLFAVTVGGAAMGIFGMLLFIPACSVFHALMKEAIQKRLREKNVPKEKWENPSS